MMISTKHKGLLLVVIAAGLLFSLRAARASAPADDGITSICPGVGIQQRGAAFEPGGIILTSFDKSAIWLYNVDNGRRYPLPETAPCNHNCTLSPDASWLTYFNRATYSFNKMRLDGTGRTLIAENAAEVTWWNADTLLIWTPGKGAYLRAEGGDAREYLNVDSVTSVQPGGRYGVVIEPQGDGFERALIDLERRGLEGISDGRVDLGADAAYFNALSWSPDGAWLAYVAPVLAERGRSGGEIFGIRPGDPAPAQWTNLIAHYGAERINGLSVGELSWSPDGTRIAFWVTEITGGDVTVNLGSAVIHVLDVNSGAVSAYCGFSTTEHTPNPPKLVWSPDSTHIAFGGDVPGDDRGYLLLALDVASGTLTALSEGIYPVFGSADVIAWGRLP